jgi:hypothetical protein
MLTVFAPHVARDTDMDGAPTSAVFGQDGVAPVGGGEIGCAGADLHGRRTGSAVADSLHVVLHAVL